MSEQKEMKNMKNDAAEQQADAAAFQVVNEGFSTHEAIEEAKTISGKPTMIVMKTVKGKGVPEIENQVGWHGKAPSKEECERFIKAVEAE